MPPPDTVGGDSDGGGAFNVGQLQQQMQDMAIEYEQQLIGLKEQLVMVTQNQEQVKTTLEGKIRRLERELQKSGSDVSGNGKGSQCAHFSLN